MASYIRSAGELSVLLSEESEVRLKAPAARMDFTVLLKDAIARTSQFCSYRCSPLSIPAVDCCFHSWLQAEEALFNMLYVQNIIQTDPPGFQTVYSRDRSLSMGRLLVLAPP